jgi:chaperonin cofactor prefoldin
MSDDEDIRSGLEQTVAEYQMVSQQKAAITAQANELRNTLEHLKSQDENRPVFQQVGPILVEVEDVALLLGELTESLEKIAVHETRLGEREGELKSTYEQAVKQFEEA